MSAATKKRLTEKDIKILVRGKEVRFPKDKKRSLFLVIDSFLDEKKYSGEDVFGKEINNKQKRSAKYLKGSRVKSGLSQLDVCSKLNIKQPNLSSMENGKRPIPTNLAKRFARIYKCNVDILLGKK